MLTITPITRQYVSIDVASTLSTGAPAVISGVDVALVPPRSAPIGTTAWVSAAYSAGTATVLVAGHDADPTGALVVPAGQGADLWIRVVDSPEVTATKVFRILVLEGPSGAETVVSGTPFVQSVAGLTGIVSGAALVTAAGLATQTALNAKATIADVGTAGTPTGDALRAAYGAVPTTARGATTQPSMVTTNATGKLFAASTPPAFAANAGISGDVITVDVNRRHQEMLGFGAAITDSAAYCLTKYLTRAQRTAILTEMFSPSQQNFSCVRICMGSSDYTNGGLSALYTYDDTPAAQSDGLLTNFSIARDQAYIIPVLQEILTINPSVRIFAAPWSPPARMKTGGGAAGGLIGGSFNPAYMQELANYFVKFVQAYAAQGIPIFAVTPQNEPEFSPTGYPGCLWSGGAQENTFAYSYLAPAFEAAQIGTRIVGWDESTADSSWGRALLIDANAGPVWDGVAWHGYSTNDYVAMKQVWRNRPSSHVYMTEFCLANTYTFGSALKFFAGDQGVAVPRNQGEAVIMWNLMLDQAFMPTVNPGALFWPMLTVQNDGSGTISRNADYYVLGHVSRYLQRGAVRVASSTYGYGQASATLQSVAYLNPDGTRVLFLNNASGVAKTVQVTDGERGVSTFVSMASGDIATVTWGVPALTNPTGAALALTAPGAPVLTATTSNGSVNLSWTTPTPGNSSTARYILRRATSAGQETLLATVGAPATTWTDSTGLADGTTYYYTVTAVNAAGEGAASNEATAAPQKPTAPVLTATNGTDQVSLSWTAATRATGYTINRGTTSGGEAALTTVAAGTTSYVDTTGTDGTTYYFTVTATNPAGSTASNEATGIPQLPPPPGSLTLTGTNGTAPALSWTAAANATGYNVMRGTVAAGAKTQIATLTSTATTYSDYTANGGTTYYYTVVATNRGGNTTSNEVSAASTRPATPTTTAQPTLWLRSDAISGVANSTKLASWPDAGSGRTPAVQSTAANQPTFATAQVNGLPAVVFTRVATTAMTAAQSLPAENVTVLMVCARTSSSSNAMVAGGSAGAKQAGGLNIFQSGTGNLSVQENGGNTLATSGNNTGTTGTWHILEASVDTLANAHVVVAGLDGTVTTATPPAYSNAQATTGTNIAGTVGVENGDVNIAELIVFQSCLSTADRHSWVAYLGTVYGITVGAA